MVSSVVKLVLSNILESIDIVNEILMERIILMLYILIYARHLVRVLIVITSGNEKFKYS